MDLASFDFIPLREGTAIPSFRCKDPDLNGFLFDDAKDATRLMCFDLKPFKDGNPELVPVLRSA